MSLMEDLLGNLKDFILEQNNKQTDQLISHVNSRISELQKVIQLQVENNKNLEKELQQVKERNDILEKQIRKNNIIIFNLDYKEGDLLNFAIPKLNKVLKLSTPLTGNDISNIYTIGKSNNKPVIVHFVRYLTKQSILKHCKNLKGTDVKISEILTEEERKNNKILVRHLKEAKEKNQKAHIYRNKLYIENKAYSINELEEKNGDTDLSDDEGTEIVTRVNEESGRGENDEQNKSKKRKVVRASSRRRQKERTNH